MISFIKLLVLSSQLQFDLDLVARLQRVVQFLSLIYVPSWLVAK